MQDVNKIFIEEGLELVSNLESYLMDLESNGVSEEIVNGIFRVMHSLKGGSSMFGFHKLDELTHNLETIYNNVRDDNSILSQSIIDITFKSVDLIKELLSENIKAEISEQTDILIADIKNIINGLELNESNEEKKHQETSENINDTNKYKTYYILFRPEQDILSNGTNPLYIIEELVNLGKDYCIIAKNNSIPSLNEYNIEMCYVWWEIILYTKESIDELNSVFMFVEDDAEIKIEEIVTGNILSKLGIKEFIHEFAQKNEYLDLKVLIKMSSEKLENEDNSKEILNKRSLDSKIKEVNAKSNVDKKTSNQNKISNIKVSSAKLDELMNMVSELVTTQARLHMLSENENNIELNAISEDITKITRRLRDNAFSIILIPIESILIKFKRLVRDLSIELNKNIQFITEGTDTELDKTIIETINEPLLHLIRNSIDHGIESKEERIRLGKPEQGTIKLKSFYSGASVHIQISDDGAGLRLDAIKSKAIEKNIISIDSNLTEKEIIELIWLPGFSTVSIANDVSGRGVGTDVVRKKISDVRGDIEIETKPNVGTTFTLKLPLTLSIIDGLLVQVAGVKYLIQLSVIKKIHKIKHKELTKNYTDVVVIDNTQISYVYLRDYFSYSNQVDDEHIIIIDYEGTHVGIVVDEVLGDYQAVLKPLGKHYKKNEIFSGGTILGDGSVALVLDTTKIIRDKSKIIINI